MAFSFSVIRGKHDGQDEIVSLVAAVVVDLPEHLLALVLEGAEVVFVPGVVILGELENSFTFVRIEGRSSGNAAARPPVTTRVSGGRTNGMLFRSLSYLCAVSESSVFPLSVASLAIAFSLSCGF